MCDFCQHFVIFVDNLPRYIFEIWMSTQYRAHVERHQIFWCRHYVACPNVACPNVARPNVAFLNVARPNVARPNVARPNVARPNVAFLVRLG
jgi:hypothetical protein